ncbi:hypothetical protein D3C81_1069440 [compost metagenome]
MELLIIVRTCLTKFSSVRRTLSVMVIIREEKLGTECEDCLWTREEKQKIFYGQDNVKAFRLSESFSFLDL